MELFKSNYIFIEYDKIEESSFEYSKYNCSFFYPLLFPAKQIKSVQYINSYDINSIRKYNLYYSLLYVVNKHILKKYTHFNKDDNLLYKADEIDTTSTESKFIPIDEAIRIKVLPLRYYALKYIKKYKSVEYKKLDDSTLIKLIDSLIFLANFLGILSSSSPNDKPIPMRLITDKVFEYEKEFLSLSVSVQVRVFIDWINKKTIVITGSTGIGKSSQVPKLLLYISLLFDGYTNYDIFNSDDYKPEKKILFALPRKLLVQTIGEGLMNSLKITITKNQLIKLQYRKIQEDKKFNNSSEEYKMLIATSQSLFKFIDDCSLLICDEIHEHTDSIDTLITISRLLKIHLVLISATIDADKPIINKFFDNYSYIDIKGPPPYKITSINMNKINKDNYKNKELICGMIVDVVNKYIYQCSKPGENTIIFLPSKTWLNLLAPKLVYKDIEIRLLYRDAEDYKDNVIKYVDNENTKRHLIISTPIAESSITIKKLALVIDSGLFYNSNYNILNIDFISYWSHIQRKGRVGRDFEGYYISLFDIDTLSKVLTRTIDGSRLFTTILQIYHYLSLVLKRDINKTDILDNYIFPPTNIQRIYDVYDYLLNKNFTNVKYTSLLVSGLSCSIIDYLYIYEKYYKTPIYNELKEYEENPDITYQLSNTLFKELCALNKKIYHVNGKGYYMFFNDQEKSYSIKKNNKLLNNKYYKIIKYNTILFSDL